MSSLSVSRNMEWIDFYLFLGRVVNEATSKKSISLKRAHSIFQEKKTHQPMAGDRGFIVNLMLKHHLFGVNDATPGKSAIAAEVTPSVMATTPFTPDDSIAFLSGFMGGVADTFANFPPYGLHLRYQRNECVNPFKNVAVYMPRELYRGTAAYAAIIPVTCIADGFSAYLKRHFGMPYGLATFISGMTAAFFVAAPVANVIIQQQKYSLGFMEAIRAILKRYGAYKLTTGMSCYLTREGIYSTSVFSAKPWLQKQHTAFENDLVASFLVGIIATFLSQPPDTIGTYMVASEERISTRTALSLMWQGVELDGSRSTGGLKRLYRGSLFRGYAVVAGIYVMSKVSDATKQAFRVHKE